MSLKSRWRTVDDGFDLSVFQLRTIMSEDSDGTLALVWIE